MASEFRFWFWCICQSSAESGQSLVFSADKLSLGQHLQCIWESSHKKLWERPWLVSVAPEGCGVASPHAQPRVSCQDFGKWWRYLKAHLGSKKAVASSAMCSATRALRTLSASTLPQTPATDACFENTNYRDNPISLRRSWGHREPGSDTACSPTPGRTPFSVS